MSLRIFLTLVCFVAATSARADETPEDILKRAIQAHGGADKLAKTLTGKITAKARGNLGFGPDFAVNWEETFELPRRYKRVIKGEFGGKPFHMEYAVTEGSGWIRRGKGEIMEFKGKQLPLEAHWHAMLATLPAMLGKGYKLSSADKEKVGGREAVGIKVSSKQGEAVLYFDATSGLLLKSKKRMQHPLLGKEAESENLFSKYKNIDGIQYPMNITTFIDGKKAIELNLTEIKFLNKIDDAVFAKPK